VTPAEPQQTHVIQAGDTFSGIAAKYLGDAKYAGLVLQANPDMDPRRLQIGARVVIPPRPAERAEAASPRPETPEGPSRTLRDTPPVDPSRAYTVQPDDNWHKLAERFYGTTTKWPRLFEHNRDRVPDDPARLPVGTVIELPDDVTALPSAPQ
jgi:nucleoid-associated protein YgaU